MKLPWDRSARPWGRSINIPSKEKCRKIPQQKISYLTNLRTIQEWIITPQLKSVAGVNEINSFGGYFKQYQVIVSPEKLLKYAITVDDVYSAIGNNNENVGGNLLERGTDQYIVRGVGLIKDVSDIENIVLKSRTRNADLHPRCGPGKDRRSCAHGCGHEERQG